MSLGCSRREAAGDVLPLSHAVGFGLQEALKMFFPVVLASSKPVPTPVYLFTHFFTY